MPQKSPVMPQKETCYAACPFRLRVVGRLPICVCVSTLYVYINIYYVWQAQKHPVQLPDAVCDLLDLIEHFTGTQVI